MIVHKVNDTKYAATLEVELDYLAKHWPPATWVNATVNVVHENLAVLVTVSVDAGQPSFEVRYAPLGVWNYVAVVLETTKTKATRAWVTAATQGV